VDLFEDEVVTGLDRTAEVLIQEADAEASGAEEIDEPAMGFADVGGVGEGGEQQSGCGAGENADDAGDGEPAGEIEQEAELFWELLWETDWELGWGRFGEVGFGHTSSYEM
jgi:hypothetical protein